LFFSNVFFARLIAFRTPGQNPHFSATSTFIYDYPDSNSKNGF